MVEKTLVRYLEWNLKATYQRLSNSIEKCKVGGSLSSIIFRFGGFPPLSWLWWRNVLSVTFNGLVDGSRDYIQDLVGFH